MTEFHSVGVSGDSQRLAETVGSEFVTRGLLDAREKTWKALAEIRDSVKEGITEREGHHRALEVFRRLGTEKHWHKPYLRFGPGTALTFRDPLQPEYRLKEGDPFYIDIGPVWLDPDSGIEYEGDVGDTFVLGSSAEAEAMILDARKLFREATEFWRNQTVSGKQLYTFLENQASELGYSLKSEVDGHRLSDYPHNKYTKERLARTVFCPTPCLWVLELQITRPGGSMGAFYEDLLMPANSQAVLPQD